MACLVGEAWKVGDDEPGNKRSLTNCRTPAQRAWATSDTSHVPRRVRLKVSRGSGLEVAQHLRRTQGTLFNEPICEIAVAVLGREVKERIESIESDVPGFTFHSHTKAVGRRLVTLHLLLREVPVKPLRPYDRDVLLQNAHPHGVAVSSSRKVKDSRSG